VKKADVSFSKKQAIVAYDPKQTTVAAIIRAVDQTPSMMGPSSPKYGAKIHRAS